MPCPVGQPNTLRSLNDSLEDRGRFHFPQLDERFGLANGFQAGLADWLQACAMSVAMKPCTGATSQKIAPEPLHAVFWLARTPVASSATVNLGVVDRAAISFYFIHQSTKQ